MTTRSDFLATVRERLRHGIPENPLRPLAEPAEGPIPYTVDLSDLAAAFTAAAEAVGATVIDAEADLESLLRRVLDETKATGIAVADDPAIEAVRPALAALGIEPVSIDDVSALASAQLGITGARAGVALTGSVVIDSSVPGARLVSLLPDTHLALLPRSSIVPTPGDVLRSLTSPLPSNLVLITGPSRSADIELQLTVGVHGPRRLLVALL